MKPKRVFNRFRDIGVLVVLLVVCSLLVINGSENMINDVLKDALDNRHLSNYPDLVDSLRRTAYRALGVLGIATLFFLHSVSRGLLSDFNSLTAFLSRAPKTNILINLEVFNFQEFRAVAALYNSLVKDRLKDYKVTTEMTLEISDLRSKLADELDIASRLIDHLPFPIYIVPAMGEPLIISSNKAFALLVGKEDSSDVLGKKEGDLFYCGRCVTPDMCHNVNMLLGFTVDSSNPGTAQRVSVCQKGDRMGYLRYTSPIVDKQDKHISTLHLFVPTKEEVRT